MMVHYILLFGEWVQRELGVSKHNHLRSSHYVVSLASRTRTFDCSAAREQIGYSPVVALEVSILMPLIVSIYPRDSDLGSLYFLFLLVIYLSEACHGG